MNRPLHPLRQWRDAHGLSQAEVGRQAGMTQAMVSLVERYQRIPWREALDALCRVTGLPTEALVRPDAFIAAHPGFAKRLPAPKPIRRGRPPKRRPKAHQP